MDYTYAPGRNHLFVPGPVNIPDQVLRAMNRNNEDYRSPAIPALTKIPLSLRISFLRIGLPNTYDHKVDNGPFDQVM